MEILTSLTKRCNDMVKCYLASLKNIIRLMKGIFCLAHFLFGTQPCISMIGKLRIGAFMIHLYKQNCMFMLL
uniref:S-acyltransferase n=1 Tax=Rhizophora mucronata TaxID=61149 RepID=A0A2P2KFX2_RHIMU